MFGDIANGKMILNDAGQHTQKCWLQIPQHFPNIILHEHIIMPNHIHGIIEITTPVGANQHSPLRVNQHSPLRANQHSPPKANQYSSGQTNAINQLNRVKNISPLRSPSQTIGSVVRGFKIGVTKWFRENLKNQFPAEQPVWQRNYYDHIIRNEKSYQTISKYIINNPIQWHTKGLLEETIKKFNMKKIH